MPKVDPTEEHSENTGYRPMKASPDAIQFAPSDDIQNADLPPKVDLRPYMTPVLNQGQTSSCVANAVAGAYDYWVKRASDRDYDVSRLFVYYNARWRNGDADKDAGSHIQLAMEGMKNFGACSEKTWPFKEELVTVKPNRSSYEEAAESRVKEMQQVPNQLEAWKQALASGFPIVFGCLTFESFDDANKRGGVVPMPSPNEAGRASHGGHAMCAVGYSEAEKCFIVRNSWGEDWGDKGYCYMPYNYLMNDKFNDGDNWIFVPSEPIPDPKDVWVDDDQPVTNGGQGVDFNINPYPVDAYEHINFTYWEEETVEWNSYISEEYSEYVEYVETEEWSSMEEYSIEEAMEMSSFTGESSESSSIDNMVNELDDASAAAAAEDNDADDDDADDDDADDDDADDDDADDDDADDDDADDDDADDDDADDDDEGDDEGDDDAGDDDAGDDEGDDDAGDDDAGDDDAGDDDAGDDDDDDEDDDDADDEGDDDDDDDDEEK